MRSTIKLWINSSIAVHQLFVGWESFQAFWYGEPGVLGMLSLPASSIQSLYIALFGGGMIVLAGLNRSILLACRPSVRFKGISDSIQKAMDDFGADGGEVGLPEQEIKNTLNTRAAVREMAHRLDDFKIPYPPLEGEKGRKRGMIVNQWRWFFPKILAASRAGKLREARALWANGGRQNSSRR